MVANFLCLLFSSPDAAIEPWLKQLWVKLLSLYPLPVGQSPINDSVLYPVELWIIQSTLYNAMIVLFNSLTRPMTDYLLGTK
jgi:hypothetical protein